MKVVILAGGFGSRLSEYTSAIPKPLVEIGGKPVIWHIMKIYSKFGFNDFVICAGYKGEKLNKYFLKLKKKQKINLLFNNQKIKRNKNFYEDCWTVRIVDTGLNTQTGGRIKKIKNFITEENFLMTYGDGLSNVNIKRVYDFHIKNKKYATVTTINPQSKFGSIKIDKYDYVSNFSEKPIVKEWINGGFFVLNKKVFEFIDNYNVPWENAPFKRLTNLKQLKAYKHKGFWKAMDTLKDKIEMNKIWKKGAAPWKIWDK